MHYMPQNTVTNLCRTFQLLQGTVWLGIKQFVCHHLNVHVPSEFLCWNPNPQWDDLEDGTFGHDLIMRVEPSWMGLMLSPERLHRDLCHFHHVRTQQKGTSCEQEEDPQQNATMLETWYQDFQLPELWK